MLYGRQVAFLVANEGVEQIELTEPWKAVEEAGGAPVLIAPEQGNVQTVDHLAQAQSYPVDLSVADANPDDFLALVLPGGVVNPDLLRTDALAMEFIRSFFVDDRPVAAICHAPWALIEAGVATGRTLTSWPSVQTDLRNAGATWVDDEVVVDGNLVTGRRPDDLPAFIKHLYEVFTRAAQDA